MTKWISMICFAVGITAYRTYFGHISVIEAAIVGGISGAIGGALSYIYDRYLGKHNSSVLMILNYVAGFLLFCIPGYFVGAIVNIPFKETVSETVQTIVIALFTLIIAGLLTYRQIRKHKRIKLENIFKDVN